LADSASLEEISKRSKWYGDKAQAKRSTYIRLKGLQVVLAAAIPLISVAAASISRTGCSIALPASPLSAKSCFIPPGWALTPPWRTKTIFMSSAAMR